MTKKAIDNFFLPYKELKKRSKEINLVDEYMEFVGRSLNGSAKKKS